MTTATTSAGASCPVPRLPGRGRSFITDDGLRQARVRGRPGFAVTVRLTSYRSLPLSCVERIDLSVDGAAVPPADITFVLGGQPYALAELGDLSSRWWFILDAADLLVPRELAPGEHQVEGTLTTVEPYVTNGRFTFISTASKRLRLRAEL